MRIILFLKLYLKIDRCKLLDNASINLFFEFYDYDDICQNFLIPFSLREYKFNSVLQYIFSYLLETGLDNFTFEKSFEKYILPSKKCIRPRRKNDNAREEYEWPKPRSASGKYK